jgi:hypothetical protein
LTVWPSSATAVDPYQAMAVLALVAIAVLQ